METMTCFCGKRNYRQPHFLKLRNVVTPNRIDVKKNRDPETITLLLHQKVKRKLEEELPPCLMMIVERKEDKILL